MANHLRIPPEDLIRSLSSPGHAETRIKGSRFIGLAAAAFERGEAGKIIQGEEKKYHDATHHCWGWCSLEQADNVWAYNDDGEPAGTAGVPILRAIQSAGLAGVVVVVTRYFGGVKLGTGALARAYSETAKRALETAKTTTGMLAEEYALCFEYPLLGRINKLIEQEAAVVTSRRFEERVGLNIAVSKHRAEPFIRSLNDSAAGRIEITPLGIRPVFPE